MLNTQHIYALDANNDLLFGLIPLAVDHKINHTYPKSLCIPILHTAYDSVHVPRTIMFGTLNPTEIDSTEVSNISWTKTEKSQNNIRNRPTELPTIPPESSFQPEHNNSKRQSLLLQDACSTRS